MMDDFEQLLNNHEENQNNMKYNKFNNYKNGVKDSQMLKADKSASLFDFIKMIDKIVTLTMKDHNITFIPDEGKETFITSDNTIDGTIITYKLISREAKKEMKPRFREEFKETTEEGKERIGEIYGQKFKCYLQFNIFSSVYATAEEVMELFEDMMLIYTGYFKKNGVSEIIFDKQFTDDYYNSLRQTLSIRNLRYYVETEKLTVIMRETIEDIQIY